MFYDRFVATGERRIRAKAPTADPTFATLLPNGKVQFAGGLNGSALSTSELFDTGLGFSTSRRHVIAFAGIGRSILSGQWLALFGSGFTGDSEGSGGVSSTNSAVNLPVLQLRRLDNEQEFFVYQASRQSVQPSERTRWAQKKYR